jgi:hypothetical protein
MKRVIVWVGMLVVLVSGCSVKEVEGELGVAREGDPCAKEQTYACTRAFDAELVCDDGEFVLSQECPGGCTLENVDSATLLQCLGEDGEPK